MTKYQVRLTVGHLGRHAPSRSAQGREAALIDVAQDLLLRELADVGILELLAFKGGTAIRKVVAGASGRFSTDLDFAIRNLDDESDAVLDMLARTATGIEAGDIRFGVTERRGRLHITYESSMMPGVTTLSSKLDVGPPPWLAPIDRPWIQMPIHAVYGGPLPLLTTMSLDENIAEKVARLNRRTYARDAYDLVWLAGQAGVGIDRELVRRLAVLKCWVDRNGLTSSHHSWAPVPDAEPFDSANWLRPRSARAFDDEQIGVLTTPPPDLDQLGRALPEYYAWLSDLDSDEKRVAKCEPGDRSFVLQLLSELPGGRVAVGVW